MSDEIEKIKEIKETSDGYIISFVSFVANAEYRLYWIDKEKRILLWNYYDLNENNINADYSFYTIDDNNYNKLNKQSCNKSISENITIVNSMEESWKVNCNKYMYLHIDNDSLFTFPVNSNTMYVNVRVKENDNRYNLYYHSIEDLGRGVKEALDWDNFSKDSILATLDYKVPYLYLNWYGFYNEHTKSRDWVDRIDFQEDAGKLKNIRMQRCNIDESY